MNAIKNIYAVLALIALCLSSCEMKNELEGKYNLKNDEGLLTLDLVNKTQATPTTKAESTSIPIRWRLLIMPLKPWSVHLPAMQS